ncbi:MAG: PhzF family phenazine biosynthesis protein [Bacillota bacterium]
MSEDPVTEAASGPLRAYLVMQDVISPTDNSTYFIGSEQGFEMGKPSYIDITIKKDASEIKEVKICGKSIIIGSGQSFL